MANEPTSAPAEGTTTEDKGAALAAARELLISEGHQVLDSSAFHSIKTSAAAQAEAKYAEAQAKLDSTQAEMQRLAEYKAKIENKDKSDAELHAEQRRAWQAADEERKVAIEAANKSLADAHAALAKKRVSNRIAALMPGSTNPEAAQMWAEKHIGKMLSTDDSGQLVWTDPTGTPHIGIAAEKNVSDWWSMDGQKFLRSGHAPGPVTAGAPSAPTPQEPQRPTRDPALSAMENYIRAEEWDKTRGVK